MHLGESCDGNALVYLHGETLFKFQYDTENNCSELDLGPGLISTPPLRMLNYNR